MHLGKVFILALLTSCHFYTAHAMEEDELLKNIKSLKIPERHFCHTYYGVQQNKLPCPHGSMALSLEPAFSEAFSEPKNYMINAYVSYITYSQDAPSFSWEAHVLHTLSLTHVKNPNKIQNQKDGLIVFWHINPRLNPFKQGGATEIYIRSLKNLATHLTKNNILYYGNEEVASFLEIALKGKYVRTLVVKDHTFAYKLLNNVVTTATPADLLK